jgi:tRNA pseudouridine38-40 synthase
LNVRREGEQLVVTASARSFLHHQVRNIVGTLRLVGDGKWTPADVKTALEAKDRSAGGPTAPASGLALMWVKY